MTYGCATFEGWRLTLCCRYRRFTHYFSDKKYGGREAALAAAQAMDARLNSLLKKHRNAPETAYAICLQEFADCRYPRGLRPRKSSREVVADARRRCRLR